MNDAIIEVGVSVIGQLLMMLIGVLGAFLMAQISKNEKLKTVNTAVDSLTKAAETTVLELQQTTVEHLKNASADGKLSAQEIAMLNKELIEKTKEKMSDSTKETLKAAGVDINGLIKGAGEAMIAKINASRQAKTISDIEAAEYGV